MTARPLRAARRLSRYGMAIACAVAATLLGRFFANPSLQTPFAWFVPAVAFSAWFGGFGPGLVTSLLTVAGGTAMMLEFGAPQSTEARIIKVAITLVAGLFLSALIASLRAALRQAAEEAVARADAVRRVRRVLESITDLFIGVDAQWRVTEINQRFAATLGLDAAIIGRDFWEQFPQLRGQDLESRLRRVATEGHPAHFESPFGDSAALWFETHAYPEPHGGLSIYMRDITSRKRSEQELIDADRTKDEFLAILAHELRNPLAPIRNAVELLRQEAVTAETRDWARDVIDRQVDHMSRLIEDLVDVSRVTRNRLELRKSVVTLAEVVDAAVETSLPLIERRQHRLGVSLPQERLVIEADVVRLAQVFMNLLTNAAKYTPAGGSIRVVGERRGTTAIVSVIDDGIGIDADKLPRLFEMFFQVEDVLKRPESGLGIGLALVRHVVELHGGAVSAHSAGPGRGTEIRVQLPLAAAEPAPAPAPVNGARKLPRQRILVVDDNEDSAAALCLLLRHAGAETVAAHDGGRALELAKEVEPDIVLLDIGLPTANGYEVAAAMRRQPWGRDAHLIAVTGWGQESDKERSRQAGFDRHLVKPVEPGALLELIAGLRANDGVNATSSATDGRGDAGV